MNLRAALREGTPLVGTFLMVPRVEVVEMLAASGFEVIIIDLEHGPTSHRDLVALAAAARGAGAFSVARLPDGAEPTIAKALDAGVDGVLIPHVSDETSAARMLEAARFAPQGERSLNPYVRGMRYGLDGPAEANDRVAVMVMIEGVDGLENVDSIVAVEGLDAVFIGPVDLAASLGHPGQPEHPLVVETVQALLARISPAGTATGIYAPTPAAAERWIQAGASLVALSADSAMMLEAFTRTRAAVDATAEAPLAMQHT